MRLAFLCLILLYNNQLWAQQPVAGKSYKIVFEKAYLHTDRETYAAGEDIWFKAYLLNGQTNQRINSSNNLYVELINADSKMIERKVLCLENGLGNGDFLLGDSIVAGTYRIRAYTNWMRNFGDNFVFEKHVQVFSETVPRKVTKEPKKKEKSIGLVKNALPAQLLATPTAAHTIRFFPEGGSIVEGVTSVVAFKSEDALGKGIGVKGSIFTQNGTAVAEFNAPSGAGLFTLPGEAGTMYFVKGNYKNGKPFVVQVPSALLKGFTLNIRNADSIVRATISTNPATLSEYQNKSLTLTARHRGKVCFTAEIPLTTTEQSFAISKHSFPGGVIALTLYSPDGKPQCERLLYNEKVQRETLAITSDKLVYQPKGKVTVMLKASDVNGLPVGAALSLSAVDAGMIPVAETNIIAYLQLQSELRGKIENAAQYFDITNSRREQMLDMLMLTQGWRDYTWKRLADSALRISYPGEKGITVTGRLRQVWLNNPIPNANITLAAWGAQGTKLFTSKTDSAGKFFFEGVKFFGTQEMKITSVDSKGKKTGYIVVDTSTVIMYPIKNLLITDTSNVVTPFQAEAIQRFARAKKVSISDTIQLKDVTISQFRMGRTLADTLMKIDRADYPLKYLRDYLLEKVPGALRCPPIPEHVVFYGIVPGSGGAYGRLHPKFSIEGPAAKRIDPIEYGKNLLKMDFLNVSMDKINSVQVVHNRNRDGIISRFDGVLGDYYNIFLNVKPGAFDRQGFQNIQYDLDGYYQTRTFYAPKYETPSAKPDLRTTIHWEPNIVTNEKGEATITYYNADPKTKVRIVVEGITSTGVPVSGVIAYEVK